MADSRQLTQWSSIQEMSAPAAAEIFVPLDQRPETARDMAILLRTETDPGTLTQAVRREVAAIDANQPPYSIETLRTMADLTLGPARLCLFLLGIFAAIALITACVGLYAIVSYTVVQRTHEIGIRMALGAGRREVTRTVLHEGMTVVMAGLVAGLGASLGMTKVMASILYQVHATDFATLAAVSFLLAGVAAIASYIPAARAAHVDPLVALRHE